MKKAPRAALQYKVVRFYSLTQKERVIRTDITREHAKQHCRNPESAYTTCKKPANQRRTEKVGPWYDVYMSK